MNHRGKTIRLSKLKDPNCKRCELCKSSQHVCILGKGNIMAPIVLVGEAPGAAEERTGKVFCGRAGKLLDKLLLMLNMKDMVYITNACRCRPPDNRKPVQKELDACNHFLKAEIAIVKPSVIVLLGRIATTAFGFGADVNAGSKPFFCKAWPRCWIKTSWHPSYCLRRGRGATKDLLKTLQGAKEFIRKEQ